MSRSRLSLGWSQNPIITVQHLHVAGSLRLPTPTMMTDMGRWEAWTHGLPCRPCLWWPHQSGSAGWSIAAIGRTSGDNGDREVGETRTKPVTHSVHTDHSKSDDKLFLNAWVYSPKHQRQDEWNLKAGSVIASNPNPNNHLSDVYKAQGIDRIVEESGAGFKASFSEMVGIFPWILWVSPFSSLTEWWSWIIHSILFSLEICKSKGAA